jgi:vitamin B12 transporter
VSASRTEQRLRDAIPNTTVLTQKDIRDAQAVDLPSLLRREAGFEMAQNGGIGTTYSPLSLRGGNSARTLVLVDGVRVEDAAFGQTALQHVMLDQIDRIEIVRGNVSSLYGSNAVGGVIQVFTKRGTGAPAPSAEFMAGSHGTAKVQVGYGGQLDDTRFNLTASRFDTQGTSAIDPAVAPNANPDRDGYRNDSFGLNASHRLSGRHEFGFSIYRAQARLDYDDARFGGPTDVQKSAQDLAMVQAFWEARLIEQWKARFTAADSTDHRTDTLNGDFNNLSNTHTRQYLWDNEFRVTPGQQLTAGYEERSSTLDSYSAFGGNPLRRRRVDSWRLGYLGKLDRHSLQGNIRNDHYTDFGSADTYLLGYGYDLTDAWRVTASHSTAFRAPTFLDLDPAFGNPHLKPERARTNEAGVQWGNDRDRIRLVWFRTEFQDAIVLDNFFVPQNASLAKVKGIETTYTGTLFGFDVRGSFTVQEPVEQDRTDATPQRALRRSRTLGSFAAYRSSGNWRNGAELRGAGNHRDADINTGATVTEAGYTVLNLLTRYQIDKNLYFGARLENALNEKYRLVNGYNTAGRGLFVTVGWQP